MRVYLIDGFSLLYRAFYALPQSISTSSGLPTNALYGFTSMILKLLESEEEVGLGVVWDAGQPAFRMEIFPEYKAQRSAMPDELKIQLDHLDEILDAMNIPAVRAEGFEADDVLATMSKRVPEGVELMIVTGDQDAMQLVDGNVKVLRTTRGVSETKTYGRDEVVEERAAVQPRRVAVLHGAAHGAGVRRCASRASTHPAWPRWKKPPIVKVSAPATRRRPRRSRRFRCRAWDRCPRSGERPRPAAARGRARSA